MQERSSPTDSSMSCSSAIEYPLCTWSPFEGTIFIALEDARSYPCLSNRHILPSVVGMSPIFAATATFGSRISMRQKGQSAEPRSSTERSGSPGTWDDSALAKKDWAQEAQKGWWQARDKTDVL